MKQSFEMRCTDFMKSVHSVYQEDDMLLTESFEDLVKYSFQALVESDLYADMDQRRKGHLIDQFFTLDNFFNQLRGFFDANEKDLTEKAISKDHEQKGSDKDPETGEHERLQRKLN